jgi:hypothetical protein
MQTFKNANNLNIIEQVPNKELGHRKDGTPESTEQWRHSRLLYRCIITNEGIGSSGCHRGYIEGAGHSKSLAITAVGAAK